MTTKTKKQPAVDRPRGQEYKCTSCGNDTERDDLTVKRAQFQTMGKKRTLLRSRVTEWLCGDCRDADPDWNSEKFNASPGFANTKGAVDGKQTSQPA